MSDLRRLSPAERLILVQELWDSLTEQPGAVPVTEEQRRELDARLEALGNKPDADESWNGVRGRIAKDRKGSSRGAHAKRRAGEPRPRLEL